VMNVGVGSAPTQVQRDHSPLPDVEAGFDNFRLELLLGWGRWRARQRWRWEWAVDPMGEIPPCEGVGSSSTPTPIAPKKEPFVANRRVHLIKCSNFEILPF
jgi:hypothetical protein